MSNDQKAASRIVRCPKRAGRRCCWHELEHCMMCCWCASTTTKTRTGPTGHGEHVLSIKRLAKAEREMQ